MSTWDVSDGSGGTTLFGIPVTTTPSTGAYAIEGTTLVTQAYFYSGPYLLFTQNLSGVLVYMSFTLSGNNGSPLPLVYIKPSETMVDNFSSADQIVAGRAPIIEIPAGHYMAMKFHFTDAQTQSNISVLSDFAAIPHCLLGLTKLSLETGDEVRIDTVQPGTVLKTPMGTI